MFRGRGTTQERKSQEWSLQPRHWESIYPRAPSADNRDCRVRVSAHMNEPVLPPFETQRRWLRSWSIPPGQEAGEASRCPPA